MGQTPNILVQAGHCLPWLSLSLSFFFLVQAASVDAKLTIVFFLKYHITVKCDNRQYWSCMICIVIFWLWYLIRTYLLSFTFIHFSLGSYPYKGVKSKRRRRKKKEKVSENNGQLCFHGRCQDQKSQWKQWPASFRLDQQFPPGGEARFRFFHIMPPPPIV